MSRYSDWGWAPYVPVAERRRKALEKMEKLRKKGQTISPVKISGRTIAATFWGKAWCQNLEAYSDYANRLPRGRTYVRNGSVVDLQIKTARVTAMVSGSELYQVEIGIHPLKPPAWKSIRGACLGRIGSLLELLQGKLSRDVMEIVTQPRTGLFPAPVEISFKCSCPDWAAMCKHVAATLYGVGARLDHEPELLFRLRDVDHQELIALPEAADLILPGAVKERIIAEADLAGIFGIDLESGPASLRKEPAVKPKRGRPASKPQQAAAAREAPRAPAFSEKPKRGRPARKKVTPGPEKPPRRRQPSSPVLPPAKTAEKPKRGRKPAPAPTPAPAPAPAPAKRRGRPPGKKRP